MRRKTRQGIPRPAHPHLGTVRDSAFLRAASIDQNRDGQSKLLELVWTCNVWQQGPRLLKALIEKF